MIDLPQWLEDRIEEMECPNCSKNIQLKSIVGVGIKEYEVDKGKGKKKKNRTSYLVIEHTCSYCHKTYGFDIATCDVKEFVFDMIERYGLIDIDEHDCTKTVDAKRQKKKTRTKKSGISQSEVDSFTRMMKDCKSWADILQRVGISKEDMERYAKDK